MTRKIIGLQGTNRRTRTRFRLEVESREPKRHIFAALMGDGTGGDIRTHCRVEDNPNLVYVRSPDRGVLEAVYSANLPARHDLPVLVGPTQEKPEVYEVLNVDTAYVDTLGTYRYMGHHHEAHEFYNDNGGDDVVWVQKSQFVPFLGSPTDPPSTDIYVQPGYYLYLTDWQYFPGGLTGDLTAFNPAAGFVKYVLVSINAVTNILVITDGADFPPFPPSNPSNHIPTCPAQHFPICAVYLTDSTTTITWDNIYDVRLMVGGGVNTSVPGPHHLIDVGVHDDTAAHHAPAEGDIIYGYDDAVNPIVWDALAVGAENNMILRTTAGAGGGRVPVWDCFDWDGISSCSSADMVHNHSSAAEGGTWLNNIYHFDLYAYTQNIGGVVNPSIDWYSYNYLTNAALGGSGATCIIDAGVASTTGSILLVNSEHDSGIANRVTLIDAGVCGLGSQRIHLAGGANFLLGRHPLLFVKNATGDGWYEIGWSGASGGAGAHDLLSATHGDTVVNGPSQGSLIVGNITPAWTELEHPGRDGYVLGVSATDTLWMPRVYVYNYSVTSPETYYGVYSSHVKLGGITDLNDNYYAHYGRMEVNQSDSVLGVLGGGYHEATLTSGEAGFLIGHQASAIMDAGVYVYSVAEADYVYGRYTLVDLNEGIVYGDVVGHFINVDVESAMIIGNNIYGLYIRVDDDYGASTVCMIYLEELTGVDYGIYQAGTAPNYFGGSTTIENTAYIGDIAGGNYTEFESDGTVEFVGDATVWDDLRVPLERGRITGSNQPLFTKFQDNGAASNGVYSWQFVNGDEIWFMVQLPHSWKEGTTIYPHLHWSPSSDSNPADNVGIGLEYTWASINADFGNTTIVTRDVSTGVNNQDAHLIHNFDDAGIDGTGETISSILICRFFRQAAASDDYPDEIWAHEIDFHYEIDTVGSRQVLIK